MCIFPFEGTTTVRHVKKVRHVISKDTKARKTLEHVNNRDVGNKGTRGM